MGNKHPLWEHFVTDANLTTEAPDTTNSVHPAIVEAIEKLGRFDHLPPELKEISKKFYELGIWIRDHTFHGPGTTIGLNKLFEAKNEVVSQHVTAKEKNETQAAAANTPTQ